MSDSTPQANIEASTAALCSLCGTALTPETTSLVNGEPVCQGCTSKLKQELAAQKGSLFDFPGAITLGLIGAAVGAAVWAAIVVFTNFEVGYVAVLVGFLAGMGVKFGAGKARGKQLQMLAAGCAVFGLVVAKYFILAHYIREYAANDGVELSWFDPQIISTFPAALKEMVSVFDLLWLFLALSAAYRIPAPAQVRIEG